AFSLEAYAATAREFSALTLLSEPVALASFDAFMGAGFYGEALALFERSLRIEQRPLLFAEAYAAQRKAGVSPDIPTGAYALLADALNAPGFLIEGALAEMRRGRLSFARELARQAYERGAALPPGLLWDAGLFELLSYAPLERQEGDEAADAERLELAASAAYLSAVPALAAEAYAALIERYPERSWRPYAAMARLEAAQPPVEERKSLLPRDIAGEPEPGVAAFWYERMASLFPRNAGAALEYSAWLLSQARDREALSMLKGLTPRSTIEASLLASLLARAEPSRARAIALGLLARHPESPQAVDTALSICHAAGLWKEYGTIRVDYAKLAPALPRAWFWDGLDAFSLGDYAKAETIFAQADLEYEGYSASYNMGLSQLAQARYGDAARSFSVAASKAADTTRKSVAYLWEAKAHEAGAKPDAARAAYRAALQAYPLSLEAKRGLTALDAMRP
ncbi:MAG TPA: hypothetical protein DCG47_10215, partial [Spirochaetaceae bacterium]|nr:hypothetical protein [Spirochaetaceae bacterium]